MIHRQILTQPVLPLRLVPLLRRRTPVHKETIRLPNRTRQNTEILAPRKLRNVRNVTLLSFREVLTEGLLEFGCEGVVVDCQREGAGCLEGGRGDGVSGQRFGFDDAFDAGEDFGAGRGLGGADVDCEARGVDYDVFGVAGLDGGAGYDGGVVAVLGLAKGRYMTGEVARVSFSFTPFFFPFPWLGDSMKGILVGGWKERQVLTDQPPG